MASLKDKLLGGAIGIAIFFLVAAAALGPAFGMIYGPENRNITQNADQTYSLTESVSTNATNIDSTNSEVTVVINDTQDGSSTVTIGEGNNKTVTLQDDITVGVDSIASDDSNATLTYEYTNTYGWNNSASSLFYLIPLLGLVVLLAALAGIAMRSL